MGSLAQEGQTSNLSSARLRKATLHVPLPVVCALCSLVPAPGPCAEATTSAPAPSASASSAFPPRPPDAIALDATPALRPAYTGVRLAYMRLNCAQEEVRLAVGIPGTPNARIRIATAAYPVCSGFPPPRRPLLGRNIAKAVSVDARDVAPLSARARAGLDGEKGRARARARPESIATRYGEDSRPRRARVRTSSLARLQCRCRPHLGLLSRSVLPMGRAATLPALFTNLYGSSGSWAAQQNAEARATRQGKGEEVETRGRAQSSSSACRLTRCRGLPTCQPSHAVGRRGRVAAERGFGGR